MAEKLVPLRGFEPLTPSLRTWGIHGKLRLFWQRPYLFRQYVPFSFAFRHALVYICTSARCETPISAPGLTTNA